MSKKWLTTLQSSPIPTLLAWEDQALSYFTNCDLLGDPVGPIQTLWDLPDVARLVRLQQPDGSWKYPGKVSNPEWENYFLLETFRNLRVLVEVYGFNRQHPAIEKAAEFVFSCQTEEGDIRGILGNQYIPYYHSAILEILIKAGYVSDPRVKMGLDWLLSMRQEDGGWIVPTQMVLWKQRTGEFWLGESLPPDRSRPHAHMATGMALRGLAVHPDYQGNPEVIAAGEALKSRFFQPDRYNDRKATSYWFKYQFPFWWGNLLTALDSLYRLGFDRFDLDITRGLEWFNTHQEEDGLWPTGYGSGGKAESNRRWVGLAVCRVLKRFYREA
jgi:hypothetical protein